MIDCVKQLTAGMLCVCTALPPSPPNAHRLLWVTPSLCTARVARLAASWTFGTQVGEGGAGVRGGEG